MKGMVGPFKNNSGMTLIEVMVASFIGLIVIAGITMTMQYTNRVAKTGDINRQIDDIKRQFQTWIYNKNNCDASFGGMKNGDPPLTQILRNKAPIDPIIRAGDRIPGTDWTLVDLRLLSVAEMNQRFPLASGSIRSVDPSGLGTAMIHVRIRQLKGSAGTTQLTQNDDRGSFGNIDRDLFFPIQAYFGVGFTSVAYTTDGQLSSFPSNLFQTSTTAAQGGLCCFDCPSGDGTTMQAAINAQTGATVTANGGTNPAYIRSAAEDPAYTPVSVYDAGTNSFMWSVACAAYNLNGAIIECANTGSTGL